ncbi:hypothetical protein [Sulfurimonas sp.]
MKKVLKISMIAFAMLLGSSAAVASPLNGMGKNMHKSQGSFSPVLEAEDFVQVASKLDKSNRAKSLSFLERAQAALKKAPASAEIKELKVKIDAIKKAIKNNEKADKLYLDVIYDFNSYINKIKDWGYEIRAHDEEATDIRNFKMKEKSDVF